MCTKLMNVHMHICNAYGVHMRPVHWVTVQYLGQEEREEEEGVEGEEEEDECAC